MKTDRELLELAAKAADVSLYAVWSDFGHFEGYRAGSLEGNTWNPLEDDGDALRLAVDLGLDIEFGNDGDSYSVSWHGFISSGKFYHHESDRRTATRLAILTTAAEIGAGA